MGPTNEHLYVSEEMRDYNMRQSISEGKGGRALRRESWSSAISNGRAERDVKGMKARRMLWEVWQKGEGEMGNGG